MTTPRSRVGVTVLNGKLYAVGGYDGASRLNTVEVFDPIANEWWDVKAMNHKRRLGKVLMYNFVFTPKLVA